MGAFDGLMEGVVGGLMGAIVGSVRSSVGSMGAVIGSMAGSLMLEHDFKCLDGLILVGILGASGQLDGVDSQAHERR